MTRWVLLLVGVLCFGTFAFLLARGSIGNGSLLAAADASLAPQSVTDALAALEANQEALEQSVAELQTQMSTLELKEQFPRSLTRGDTGADVSELQQLLAQVPGLAATTTVSTSTSATYTKQTMAAVMAFQTSAGLKASGTFDQATRDALIASLTSSSTASSAINLSGVVDPSVSIANLETQIVQLSSAIGQVQGSVSSLGSQVNDVSTGISNAVAAAMTLTSVVATPSKTSATVSWVSSSGGTSEVDYAKVSTLAGATVVASSTLALNHSLSLTGLTASTTYYYRALSADAAGDSGVSPTENFTTTH